MLENKEFIKLRSNQFIKLSGGSNNKKCNNELNKNIIDYYKHINNFIVDSTSNEPYIFVADELFTNYHCSDNDNDIDNNVFIKPICKHKNKK